MLQGLKVILFFKRILFLSFYILYLGNMEPGLFCDSWRKITHIKKVEIEQSRREGMMGYMRSNNTYPLRYQVLQQNQVINILCL